LSWKHMRRSIDSLKEASLASLCSEAETEDNCKELPLVLTGNLILSWYTEPFLITDTMLTLYHTPVCPYMRVGTPAYSSVLRPTADYAPARPMSPSPTHNASFLAQQSQYTYCWPGTRSTLLDDMDHWAETSTSDNSLVYWLADVAGSGKSTIAQSLADDWRDRKILGGHHDFALRLKRFDYDFIPEMFESWSNQLAATFPERAGPINQAREELKSSSVELNWSFEDYLRFLVLQPLSNLQRAHHGLSPQAKIVFILDSLDECPPDICAKIVQGLKIVNASHGVKFLLISRVYPGNHESDLTTEILQLPSVTR
ncbi:307_t:CDS:2, partial [Acaulospora colombiana]